MTKKIDKNLWISASAGSGKTKTLIDRFLALLLAGISPQKILCVTFTRSAAAEMLARITNELSSWVLLDEESLKIRLSEFTGNLPTSVEISFARNCFANFLDAQPNLHIGTIHSFCQYIINKFPFESKTQSNCKLIDSSQNLAIIEQAKMLLIQDKENKNLLAGMGDFVLNEMLEKILFISSMAPKLFESPDSIENYIKELQIKLGNADINAEKYIAQIKKKMTEYSSQLAAGQEAGVAFVMNWMKAFSTIPATKLLETLKNLTFTKADTPRQLLLTKKQKEQFTELELFIREIQEIQLEYMQACDAHEITEQTKAFLWAGYNFMRHYNQIKESAGYLDYADLIARCLSLLEDEIIAQWIRCHLNDKFSHIMVDEAQDVNLAQWKLIRILLGEFFHNFYADSSKTLFVVGDLKQSIYSFQGTSPYLFMGMEQSIKSFASQFNVKIQDEQLNKSFRSDEVILKFVDRVFAVIKANNPEYFFEDTCHIATQQFKHCAVELWPPILSQSVVNEEEEEEFGWQLLESNEELEDKPYKVLAKKLAIKIQNLIDRGVYKPSEVMILVCKRDVLMEQIIRELKLVGVPVSGMDRIILNQNIAVEDLLALGKFILYPYDDYNLACLLKSPIFGISEDDLFDLCQRGNACLWTHMQSRDTSYCQLLKTLLDTENLHSPYALFSHVLDVLKIRTKFIARFGFYINQILDEFLEACLTFELEQSNSLVLFVHWFETSAFEIKQNFCHNAEEVRIMTVHAAKGLESKMVILPDTLAVPRKNVDRVLFDPYTSEILYGSSNKLKFCVELSEKN